MWAHMTDLSRVWCAVAPSHLCKFNCFGRYMARCGWNLKHLWPYFVCSEFWDWWALWGCCVTGTYESRLPVCYIIVCCVGLGVDLVWEANDSDRLSKIEWLPVAVYKLNICLTFGGDCFRNAVCSVFGWYIGRWSGVFFSFSRFNVVGWCGMEVVRI